MSAESQKAVVTLLIRLEPKDAHDARCLAKADVPKPCTCHLIRNARARASALDNAGLLKTLVKI